MYLLFPTPCSALGSPLRLYLWPNRHEIGREEVTHEMLDLQPRPYFIFYPLRYRPSCHSLLVQKHGFVVLSICSSLYWLCVHLEVEVIVDKLLR